MEADNGNTGLGKILVKVILVYLASQLTCHRRQYLKSTKFIWKSSRFAVDYLGRGANWAGDGGGL